MDTYKSMADGVGEKLINHNKPPETGVRINLILT
jgi:hypothetical protein